MSGNRSPSPRNTDSYRWYHLVDIDCVRGPHEHREPVAQNATGAARSTEDPTYTDADTESTPSKTKAKSSRPS